MIWNESQLRDELGIEGYEWFLGRVVPRTAACVFCQGSGAVTVPNDLLNETWAQQGKQTNFTKQESCWVCHEYVERLTMFVRLWIKTVPPAYRKFFLRTLTPFVDISETIPVERQQKILDALRAEPEKGWAFFGPPACGKTVMTTALYTEALWKETVQAPRYDVKARKHFPVWRISTKRMLDEHTDWAMHKNDDVPDFARGVPYPTVSVEKIAYVREHNRVPRLFLEEIDKVKETEARRANLFEIINALHDYEGQLVVNSNYDKTELAEKIGDDLAWRINSMCRIINLFK